MKKNNLFLIIIFFACTSCSFVQMAPKNCNIIQRIDVEEKGMADTNTVNISGVLYKEKSYYNFNFKDYHIILKSSKHTYKSSLTEFFKFYFLDIKDDNYTFLIINPHQDTLQYNKTILCKSGEIKHLKVFLQCN